MNYDSVLYSCRFESGATKQATAHDEQLREDLVQKLIQQKLLGPTRQVTELDPCSLPMLDLPPGNLAALYLMYVAFCRTSSGGGEPASKSTFWVQADNTVKEIRNNYSFRMLASFLQQGTFQVATEAHLRVGHTHEDVDGVFSVCASALKTAPDLQTPRDIQRRLEDKLTPTFTKKGMSFSVDILGQATLQCFISM